MAAFFTAASNPPYVTYSPNWNRFTPGPVGTWGGAVAVPGRADSPSGIHVALWVYENLEADVTLSWSDYDGATRFIRSSNYSFPSGTWGTTVDLEANSWDYPMSHDVAMDRTGRSLAVWEFYDGTYWSIRSALRE